MRFPLVLAACAMAALLAAPGASAAAKRFEIHVGSHADGKQYFTPGEVTVDVGDVVTLVVENDDRNMFHDVALLDYDGRDIEIEVPAGETQQATFTATKAGDYQLICEVRGHKELGMKGTFHVKAQAVPASAEKATPGFDLALLSAAAVGAALVARRRLTS